MLGSGCWTAAAWATTRWKKWAGVRQIWQGHDIDSGRLNVAGRTLSALLQFHITQSLNLSCEKGRFKDRDLIIWTTHNGSNAQQCSTVDMLLSFLFLCVLMKAVIHLSLWNKPMLCMFWTAWTKHLYLLHPKSPQCSLGFRLCPFLSCQFLCISEPFISRKRREEFSNHGSCACLCNVVERWIKSCMYYVPLKALAEIELYLLISRAFSTFAQGGFEVMQSILGLSIKRGFLCRLSTRLQPHLCPICIKLKR